MDVNQQLVLPQDYVERWEKLGQHILGSAFSDERSLNIAIGSGLRPEDLTGNHKLIWQSILEIVKDGQEPNAMLVYMRMPTNSMPTSAVEELVLFKRSYTEVESFVLEAKRLATQYHHAQAAYTAALKLLNRNAKHAEVVSALQMELMRTGGIAIQPGDIASIQARVEKKLGAGEIDQRFSTGDTFFDGITYGGIAKTDDIIVIGGFQKGRKTTYMRNLMLGLVGNQDVTTALFTYENNQELTYWDFLAMVVYKELAKTKSLDLKIGGAKLQNLAHSEALKTALSTRIYEKIIESGAGNESYLPALAIRKAINNARDEIRLWNLSIYDRSTKNGGLRWLDDLERVARYHHAVERKNEDQPFLLFIDHAAIIRTNGSNGAYENQRDLSDRLNYLTQELRCSVVILTQLNEEFKKAHMLKLIKGEHGVEDYMVTGAKGGNELEGIATHWIMVVHDHKDSTLRAISMRARRDAQNKQVVYHLHPESGVITK